MKNNFKYIKRELSNLRGVRNFASTTWATTDRDGDTYEEKVETINRVWFGNNTSDYLSGREIVGLLDKTSRTELAADPDTIVHKAVFQILDYFMYELAATERPASLAVYEPAKIIASNLDILERRHVDDKDEYGNTKLYYAARDGRFMDVVRLWQLGADLDMACGPYGYTPLMVASKISILEFLCEQGANIDATGGIDDNTALDQAIIAHDIEKIHLLRIKDKKTVVLTQKDLAEKINAILESLPASITCHYYDSKFSIKNNKATLVLFAQRGIDKATLKSDVPKIADVIIKHNLLLYTSYRIFENGKGCAYFEIGA